MWIPQELEFLTREGVVSNEDNAAMQQRLNAAHAKVGVVKFTVTCAFSFAKRHPFQVSVDAGENFELINNDDPDWYLGRVVDGDGVVGWAPKNTSAGLQITTDLTPPSSPFVSSDTASTLTDPDWNLTTQEVKEYEGDNGVFWDLEAFQCIARDNQKISGEVFKVEVESSEDLDAGRLWYKDGAMTGWSAGRVNCQALKVFLKGTALPVEPDYEEQGVHPENREVLLEILHENVHV
ncbi:hypothetical protein FN846DRAFT_912027 [Sphaerosporella brunnea]|uniref:SH3 domain-containing protein n=1 Tax=Sphaerosporella brunnea TaxID=1250544 RepID=A0A5J5EHM7_9PEZI|nr:hypothetical protein FN846DRAFT_912027 [Sphaerosporella brunnea]